MAPCWRAALLGVTLLFAALAGCAGPQPVVELTPAPTLDTQTLAGDSLALAWTYDTGGPVNLPPLALGDGVFVAPLDGPLLAIERADGALRWQYEPPAGVWERALTGAGDTLFIGLRDGSLVALRAADRELLWHTELGINAQAPPRLAGDTLYVATTFVGPGLAADPQGRARLFALDAQTGAIRWSFESDNYILQTPFVQGETVYVGGSYHDPAVDVEEGGPMRLYALAAGDGRVLWTYESEDGYVKALYATPERLVYVAYQDFVAGLDAAQGTLAWRGDSGNWTPGLSGSGEIVYFGSANTIVHAWRAADGETVWEYDIPTGTFNYLLGEPTRIGAVLYFLTQQGDIMAVEAETGAFLWSQATGITARVGLTVAGGWLYIGDQHGRVYAYTNR